MVVDRVELRALADPGVGIVLQREYRDGRRETQSALALGRVQSGRGQHEVEQIALQMVQDDVRRTPVYLPRIGDVGLRVHAEGALRIDLGEIADPGIAVVLEVGDHHRTADGRAVRCGLGVRASVRAVLDLRRHLDLAL